VSENDKKKRGPKGGRDRFQFVIPKEVLNEAKELADTENRSISNMLATLVTEAIKARKEKKSGPMGLVSVPT
jgi:molybdopterin-guanine dinucleotide biosynthesis protein A